MTSILTSVVTQTGAPDDSKIQGQVENAFPNFIQTVDVVRWRPPGCSNNEAHVGHVYKDPNGLLVVINSETWEAYPVDSVVRVNDQNRTTEEQAAFDAAQR